MNRKEFIIKSLKISGGIVFGGILNNVFGQDKIAPQNISVKPSPSPLSPKTTDEILYDLVISEGSDQKLLVRKAIEEIGGIGKFVKNNSTVVLKPNIGWDRIPAQAANTSPEVVEEVAKMCIEAGAKSVIVLDNSFNDPRSCYKRSGIENAAKNAGAKVEYTQERFFKTINFPGTSFIKQWPVYTKVLEADCFINLPIAKHHNSAGLTMALKNNMGVIGGNRGEYHKQMDLSIAELATQIKPHLTILDAYRILVNNGPQGGSLKDVKLVKKCIVGINQVCVDAFGATLFDKQPSEIGHIKKAAEFGLGEIDLNKLKIKKITI